MSFFNSGQACIALSRVLAPRDRYDEVVDAAVGGDARDDGRRSPRCGDRARPRDLRPPPRARRGHIERTRADGGEVAAGGGRPAGSTRGWYVEPTIFRDVDNAGYLAQEEVFGPVVAIIAARR